MKALFADTPEALRATIDIAERCNLLLDFGHVYLPQFPVDNGRGIDEELSLLARDGLKRRLDQRAEISAGMRAPMRSAFTRN